MTIGFAAAAVAISAHHEKAAIPAKISKDEIAGKIFERDNMIETTHESGNVTLDVTTLLSSDKKFASGACTAPERATSRSPNRMASTSSCTFSKAASS
jgi:hypothetical protein